MFPNIVMIYSEPYREFSILGENFLIPHNVFLRTLPTYMRILPYQLFIDWRV